MRRCAALLLLAALLLTGCGASGTDPARETAADGRTLLTMGVLSTGSEARQFASLFNARSEEYKIEVTEYSYGAAAGRTPDDLIMQLAEGEGPDLLATTGTDFTSFERSLVFVELGPLLDEFADELVPGVYEALKGQHGIYGLPTGFGVWTFITSPSLVGGQESLTMDEARQYAAALGEGASVFDKWLTRSEFFKRVLGFSAGSFIDWETYTCSFDSEEFLDLLELCLEQRADDSPLPEEDLRLLHSWLLTAPGWFGGGLQKGGDYCFMGFPSDEPGPKGWLTTDGQVLSLIHI